MNTEDILKERQVTHGDFTDNSRVSQELKTIVERSSNWEYMSPVQREGLHMILHKISRICEGDHEHIDSWADGAGYFTLVADRLQK